MRRCEADASLSVVLRHDEAQNRRNSTAKPVENVRSRIVCLAAEIARSAHLYECEGPGFSPGLTLTHW
jgi:hypothetical protein